SALRPNSAAVRGVSLAGAFHNRQAATRQASAPMPSTAARIRNVAPRLAAASAPLPARRASEASAPESSAIASRKSAGSLVASLASPIGPPPRGLSRNRQLLAQ